MVLQPRWVLKWDLRGSLLTPSPVRTATRTGSPEIEEKPSEVNLLFISRLGHGQCMLSEEPFEILNKQHNAWVQESRAGLWSRDEEMELSFYLWRVIVLNKGEGGMPAALSLSWRTNNKKCYGQQATRRREQRKNLPRPQNQGPGRSKTPASREGSSFFHKLSMEAQFYRIRKLMSIKLNYLSKFSLDLC